MLYQEIALEGGKVVMLKSKEIDQNKLTSDCWLIQFNGLKACQSCEYYIKKTDTVSHDCGGKNIRKVLLS